MDTLPEELLAQIIASLVPSDPFLTRPLTSTLFALCRTSRKFYRIARPHLYACVHNTSGSAGRQLLRTLEENPVLAECVKYFSVQHTTEGCYEVVDARIEEEETYGTVVEQCAPLAERTIKLLPNLTVLDLSGFLPRRNDPSLWRRLFTKPNGPGTHGRETEHFRVEGLSRLQSISVHPWEEPARRLLPFLRMESLRTFEVDMRCRVVDARSITHCYYTGTRIEHLRIIGCHTTRQSDMHWLSKELINLKTLFLAAEALNEPIVLVVYAFGSHFRRGLVRSIQIAIVGLWYYEVEFEASDEEPKTYVVSCIGALLYATGRVDTEGTVVDIGEEYPGVRRVTMRELTLEEKKAYDLSAGLSRKP